MAKKTGISDAAAEMKEFNKESASLVVVLQDLAKALKDNAKAAAEFTGESVEAYTETTKEAIDLAKQLQGYTVEQLKNRKSQTSFEDKLSKLQQNQARVASKITFLEEKRLSATKEEKAFIDKALVTLKETANTIEASADEAAKLSKSFEQINQQTKIFDDLADFTKEIPGLSKVFGEFQQAADSAREAAAEGGNAFTAGAKKLTGAFTKIATAFAVERMVAGLTNADERIVSLSRNLNKSRGESEQLVKQFNTIARSTKGLTGGELQKATESFSKSLGVTSTVSANTTEELASQVKFLGLSEESANKLALFTESTGQDAKKFGNQLRGQVIASNALNKTSIRYQDITEDVASANAAIKLSTSGTGKNIVQASISAKNLGLNLSKVDDIAGSLLNFEESISAELEAELLTGQELNLEEARRLALNNDLEGVAREIKNQGITAAKFGNMNRIQQEAIAKSLGMQREDLAASLQETAAMQKLNAKDKAELNEKVRLRLAEVNKIQDLTARERARQKLIEEFGGEELLRQQENTTLAEKQALANERIAEAMDLLIPILKPISAAFQFLADNAQLLAKALLFLVGSGLVSKIGNITKMFRGLGDVAKSTATTVTQAVGGGGGGSAGAATKALSEKQIAAGFGGKAAKEALKTGGMEAAQATMQGGGGLFSKIGGFFSKMNPLKAVSSKIGKVAGKLLKFPVISSVLETIFAGQDIANLISSGGSLNEIYKGIGVRGGKAIGGIGGAALGGILGSLIPGPGTLIGGILGDGLGRWVGGSLTEALGAEGFGKTIASTFGYDKDIESRIKGGAIQAEDYVIKTLPKDTVVGAGGTKLGRTDEMVALLQELITAVKTGGNVYLDGNKVGTAMGISAYKTQ
jgi:hypothetical protein